MKSMAILLVRSSVLIKLKNSNPDGEFASIGLQGFFWTSNENTTKSAIYWALDYRFSATYTSNWSKNAGFLFDASGIKNVTFFFLKVQKKFVFNLSSHYI